LIVVKMDRDLNGEALQCRVVMGREPDHFLALWDNKMVVHDGGHASGFKNRFDKDSYDTDGVMLYQMKSTDAGALRTVQVPEKAESLNSGDCFVLVTPKNTFIWEGSGASAVEKFDAGTIAFVVGGHREIVTFNEGKETDEFWSFLGGKGDYAKLATAGAELKNPRLFRCSANSGAFTVEEIQGFTQDDLISDDVMLLDTFSEVYVWVGTNASRQEKEASFKAALEFVAHAPDGRSPDTPVLKVNQGNEPPTFTCYFIGWDVKKASDFSDPYAKRLAEIKAKGGDAGVGKVVESKSPSKPETKAAPAATRVTGAGEGSFLNPNAGSYSLAELKANAVANIDPARKEQYLSDAEFQSLFKMSKAEFDKLPVWKKGDTKKRAGLF